LRQSGPYFENSNVDDRRFQHVPASLPHPCRLRPYFAASVDSAAERGFIDDLPAVLDSLLNSTPFYSGKEVSKVVADMKRRDLERKLWASVRLL
jgi:hypothetical protein